MNLLGGKVVGSGGFGCVFYPSLNCKKNFLFWDAKKFNGISKLSLKKEIKKEEELNNKIKPIILNIKNHNNYFLIHHIGSCSPAKLSETDLEQYELCDSLINLGITKENINKNLNKLLILNIPYGGIDLYDYMSNVFREESRIMPPFGNKDFIKQFSFYNKKFINLLKHAIIPMNNLGLIHNDIKSNNLLINDKNLKDGIKIIDWALCSILTNKTTTIPENIKYRGVQFNLPFSSIVFNPDFIDSYHTHINKYNTMDIQYINIKKLIQDFLVDIFNDYYIFFGHSLYIINYFFPLIYKDSNKILDEYAEFNKNIIGFEFLINYVTSVLLNFTDFEKMKFNVEEYYYNVFSYNSDIWGFLSLYIDILFIFKNNNFNKKHIINLVKKFLYNEKYAIEQIPLKELLKDIANLKIHSNTKTKKKKK
tara:strand:+ start:1093 stop:2358 length:1266 start_codon:yes stop_codon:yes gene_type:complete